MEEIVGKSFCSGDCLYRLRDNRFTGTRCSCKESQKRFKDDLLYCIMFLWRYLPIKLPGVLVLASRRCEAHRCFADRRFMISGSEKTFRRDRMCCKLLWWETYGNQRSRECRYNKGFRHGGTSREAIYYNVTAA